MNKKLIAAAIVASVFTTGCQTTQEKMTAQLSSNTIDMNDTVRVMQRGVILMRDNVQVTAEQMKAQSGKFGGNLLAVGATTAAIGGYNNSDGAAIAGGAIALVGLASMIADNIEDNTKIAATRYTIELDKDGSILEVFQIDESPIPEGSPVFLRVFNSGKVQVSHDRSQGRVYSRAEETKYNKATKFQQQEAKTANNQEWADAQYKRRVEAQTKIVENISNKSNETIDAHNQAIRKGTTVNIVR
ncbi:hypothetical protein ACOX9X_06205 [Photobacterium leiognathi subsp. mandapamensis]|uniref:hypothetical protein n=1 Tax=Photobacterium leiognathi TaxID=553611 RepID=UPI003BF4B413